jgi:hypothetical protein
MHGMETVLGGREVGRRGTAIAPARPSMSAGAGVLRLEGQHDHGIGATQSP